MTKHKGITVELTPEQLAQLAPVFRTQRRVGNGAGIMAQVFEDGMRVAVVDPFYTRRIIDILTPDPAKNVMLKTRRVSSVHQLGKGRK